MENEMNDQMGQNPEVQNPAVEEGEENGEEQPKTEEQEVEGGADQQGM